jgi:hypothetical protein
MPEERLPMSNRARLVLMGLGTITRRPLVA